ncbi:hypothetical protein L916_03594 [Phytophthora nicotianae]|uniref:Ubiquitin-like protease family profile domain-containing protein n=1 Tax=Phytophthora nicotianae TaxID=4792 RepID=W2JLQ6_PHYNI|nr:hypothetical protein L916_03594 [Phytophthora nicotianae]
MTVLKTKSGSSFVKFSDIAGGIPREMMVNDSIIDMAIKRIADSWLSETAFIVLPLHLSRIHWGVIIVEVAFPTTSIVNFYEPLHQQGYKEEIKKVWTEKLLPFLENSRAESGAK